MIIWSYDDRIIWSYDHRTIWTYIYHHMIIRPYDYMINVSHYLLTIPHMLTRFLLFLNMSNYFQLSLTISSHVILFRTFFFIVFYELPLAIWHYFITTLTNTKQFHWLFYASMIAFLRSTYWDASAHAYKHAGCTGIGLPSRFCPLIVELRAAS